MAFADVNTAIRKGVYAVLVIAITALQIVLSVESSPPADHGQKHA